jgi:RNA 2',3'-cyclic 3'-phosphodiesterase
VPRLFIAFELPDEVREALEATIRELKKAGADVRWADRDRIHVTMRFLGEVPEASIPGVEQALRDAGRGTGPLDLEGRGVGTFGGRLPRVIWAGVRGVTERSSGELHRVRRLVDEGMSVLGFQQDRDDFNAHATLGRIKGSRKIGALLDLVRAERDREFGRFRVKELVLFKSRLGTGGSVYTPLLRVALGPAEFQHSDPGSPPG